MPITIGEAKSAREKKDTKLFVITVSVGGKVLYKTKPVTYTAADRAERNAIRIYQDYGVPLPVGAEVNAVEVDSAGRPVREIQVVKGGGNNAKG